MFVRLSATLSYGLLFATLTNSFSPVTIANGVRMRSKGGLSDRYLSFVSPRQTTSLNLEGKGEYYGESGSSYMIKEFSMYDQLEEIIKLAARPLPERPDGIVTVVKFTSSIREDCKSTEAQYERLARMHPDTIFLRCFEEYENADLLLGQARISALPTFDIFYSGKRVGRVEGPEYSEVEDYIKRYGFINSRLDLFSEDSQKKKQQLAWGDGTKKDLSKTPRTTARFVPGYDWDKNKGFFDDAADKAMESFESMYEKWTPPDVEKDKK